MACITEQDFKIAERIEKEGKGCLIAAIRPPTFVFFVNDAKLFPETYRRYMEKQLRTSAGFNGTPIRLLWRSRRKSEKDSGKDGDTRTQVNLSQGERRLIKCYTFCPYKIIFCYIFILKKIEEKMYGNWERKRWIIGSYKKFNCFSRNLSRRCSSHFSA
ncbi:hypothetical protein ACJIZ3_006681 [Penstemon smallii]|uniref:GTPase Der C-terminal KH-domain-like domain-containing protein n=1 Tax=Penstemon smallii TaxID=265156 RepID=A0ABD3S8D0_9LAMI